MEMWIKLFKTEVTFPIPVTGKYIAIIKPLCFSPAHYNFSFCMSFKTTEFFLHPIILFKKPSLLFRSTSIKKLEKKTRSMEMLSYG